MAAPECVGTYLTTRLEQLGISHLFSVPGDYLSDFLEIVDEYSTIDRIGNCNELNAGYAADGYSRVNGLGAVAVTTGVGSFSLLNAIAGSYVEHVPVVAIVGTLSNTKQLDEINTGELYHHNVNSHDVNMDIYSNVTVCHERINDPLMAPMQIDRALVACISRKQPVMIELMEDCYYMPCPAPTDTLEPVAGYTPYAELKALADQYSNGKTQYKSASTIVTAIEGAVNGAYQLIADAKHPVLWLGHEIRLNNLEALALEFLELTKMPYATSILGKAVLAESTPKYVGIYQGAFTQPFTKVYTDSSDCIIGLGVWNTDINTFGGALPDVGEPAPVFASRDTVRIAATPANNDEEQLYVQVPLADFMALLISKLKANNYQPKWGQIALMPTPTIPPGSDAITYDKFYDVLYSAIGSDDYLVSDVGLTWLGVSSFLKIDRPNGFQAQSVWASIGWSVPAGLGASYTEGVRPFVVVGDGAFKLTCQALSTIVEEKRNTVVFVMNNTVYGIEQMLLNSAPYEPNSKAPFEAANVLQTWDYPSLMNGFSNSNAERAKTYQVNTVQDLIDALSYVRENSSVAWLININLNERDYPSAWKPFVK